MQNFDMNLKSDRVLAAAMGVFKQYGFKRTSMDDIAKAADMSRPALYLLFKNKTDIFRSLSARFHDYTLQNAKTALEIQAPILERITNAMTGRMLPLYNLAHDSRHGQDLFDANQSTSADINADAEQTFLQILTDALQEAVDKSEIGLSQPDLAARELAQVFIGTAYGLKNMAFSTKDYENLLTKSVGTLFHGLGAR